MPGAVWVNGQRQLAGALHVSARDRGLMLADGLFETMRAHRGVVFRLDRHVARLQRSLGVLEIPAPADLRDWVLAAIPDGAAEDVSVRLTVTRGIGASGVAPPADMEPTVIVTVNPFPVFPAAMYEHGLAIHVASGRRNEHAMTAGMKTTAYTDAIVAFLEARRAGADDSLFLDTAGHCSEATSSNLFVRAGHELVTPPTSCAALPGITRDAVLEIARTMGVATAERAFGLDELLGADEAFLTSSLRGIAPIAKVGGRALGAGVPGELTRAIAAAHAELVARECGAQ